MQRRFRQLGGAACLFVALVLPVACGSGSGSDSAVASGSADVTTASTPSSVATTGARPPVADRPLIVLGGDSVINDVVPAVTAAIGDAADVQYLAQATITGDASAEEAWRSEITARDPDLVMLWVGPWEIADPDFAPSEEPWREYFAHDVLDGYAELLTSGGAEMLVVGPPTARSEFQSLGLGVINHFFSDLADRNDAVDFLDASVYLDAPDRTFSEALPGPDGSPERVRRTDPSGVHLCPAGVVRVVTPMLDWVNAHLAEPVEATAGWQEAPWSVPPALRNPEECPAV